jgi:uncharacterized protein (DUF952 family)
MALIYKILPVQAWEEAQRAGAFHGSADDARDGFIHFSTGVQLRETARRHFGGQAGLMLLAVEAQDLGPALKWETSRGGALFPHLYGVLETSLVRSAVLLPLVQGAHQFDADIP